MEIFPGVFLASECGLNGWFATGDVSDEYDYTTSSGVNHFSHKADISNMGMSSWFGGIGLDTWF